MGKAFGETASVHENQSGAVLFDEFHNPVVNLIPHLVRSNGSQRTRRNFHREIELATMSDVDNDGTRTSIAGKKVCDFFNRLLRGREPDANWRVVGQCLQTFQGKRQMRTAFIVSDSVDLIDDKSFYTA